MIVSKTDSLIWRLSSQLRSLSPGTKLPSLRELQKEYNVSQTTLNRVISRLKQDNLIDVIHGSGMFVAEGHNAGKKLDSIDIIYFGADEVLSDTGYVKDLIHGLVMECGKDNISTTISTLPLTSSLDSAIKIFETLRFDAVITVFLRDYSFINYFDKLRIPHVAITPDLMGDLDNAVYIDDEAVIRQIIQHLLERGHRKIAYLNSHAKTIFSRDLHLRELCYYRECIRHRLPVTLDMFCNCGHTYEEVRRAVAELLRRETGFSALIIDDQAARAVYDELQANGITPGKEISVIGIDDLEMNRYLQPGLSSIRISQHEIARLACRLLKTIYNDNDRKQPYCMIEPEFVERESVRTLERTGETII